MTVPGTYSGQPLPDGWRWVRLGEVCEIVMGRTPRRDNHAYWGGDLPWVTISDLSGDIVVSTKEKITLLGAQESNIPLVKTGTLLFSFKLTIGKMAFAGSDLYTNEAIVALTVHDSNQLNTQFLQYALKTSDLLVGSSHAVKGRTLNQDSLMAIEIPLPQIEEQRRIAGVLREQMAAVEKARAAAQVRLAAADALTSACLRAVFDTSGAAMWPTNRLGKVLVPHKEIIHPGDRENGAATFVGLEHLEPHTGRRIGSLPLDLARLTGRKPTFRKGQIVYGYLRPYLNKVWIAEFDGCSSVDQFAYEVRSDIADVRFVAWFMRSPTYLRRSEVLTTTGQLPRIGTEQIAAVEIGLPPLDEQRVIADEIDRRFATRQKLRDLLRDEADAIEKLPAALLRKVFEGKQ